MWGLLAFPFLVSAGVMWLTDRINRMRVQGWHDSATSCGLEVVEQSRSFMGWVKLEARDGELQARIEDARRKDVGTRIVVTVAGPPGFSGVKIRRETLYRPRVREIEIGDPGFDATFSIEGPMRLVAVLLDAEARSLLNEVKAGCVRMGVVNGELVAELHERQVAIILPLLLDLGRRFDRDLGVAQRLAQNARQDPEAGVRLLNLRLLAREFPGEPATIETLRQACSDPSPQVRLQAARDLHDEGLDVLLDLAGGSEEDCSAQAISILGGRLPFERTRDLLLTALRRRHLVTALACLKSLAQGGHAEAADVLTKVLARETGELAAAAARALGRVGSAASVLYLKEVERVSADPELRQAARQAIAEIQSRLPGASPGQLSLAGDEAGQLSLAEAEAGQLSLAVDPAGQLSLPEAEKPQRPERTSG